MNINNLIETLSKMPKDTLLYDSICQPTWHIGPTGEIVLAGSPCPVQTVERLLHTLKMIQLRDLPSRDSTFKRHIYEDTEVWMNTVSRKDGPPRLVTEIITSATVKSWQVFSNDHMIVDVAIGGPSYLLSADKVKVLVNKPYYQFLGVNGKRLYLQELLSVHAFNWQGEDGHVEWFNKRYWDNTNCDCTPDKKLDIHNNTAGFSSVSIRDYIKP